MKGVQFTRNAQNARCFGTISAGNAMRLTPLSTLSCARRRSCCQILETILETDVLNHLQEEIGWCLVCLKCKQKSPEREAVFVQW